MVGVINLVVTEFIASENRFAQSLRKLLRTHESGGLTDLFGASFNAISFLAEEGTTMTNGWMTVKEQVKLLLEVHQVRYQFLSFVCSIDCECDVGISFAAC